MINHPNLGNDSDKVSWLKDPVHLGFLASDALTQFDFFKGCLRDKPGFDQLDVAGHPIAGAPQELHATARMVHCYAMGQIAGVSGAAEVVDHGMEFLWSFHRDRQFGGYVNSLRDGEILNGDKLAYGHAFVLLAAASAKMAGHRDADRLIADATEVLFDHYWNDERGLFADEFRRDWEPLSTYRGMNANMHAVEALLAAAEAMGELIYRDRAGRILAFFTGEMAPAHGWRMPEHYTEDWKVDATFEGDPIFRPAGTTPGHSFEFARLLLQFWDLGGRKDDALPLRARRLYETAVADGMDAVQGGVFYTVDLDGRVLRPVRYSWPVTEAIGTAAAFLKIEPKGEDEMIYRDLWSFASRYLIDHENGGWHPELASDNTPASTQFMGKPDIYHSLQAALFPMSRRLSGIVMDLGVNTLLASAPKARVI